MPPDSDDESPAKSTANVDGLSAIFGRGGAPPYVWLMAIVLGSAGSGGLGSMLGGQQSAEDFARIEEKVDALDEKMTEIRILIATHHGAGSHSSDRP